MPVIQEGLRKLGQSELRSYKQLTHLSNPGVLQHYSGWTSLDPKITRRMSPRIPNKRTAEAPCLYASSTTMPRNHVSVEAELHIFSTSILDASFQLHPRPAVLPGKETPVPKKRGGGLARQRTQIPRLSCPQPNHYTD
jgi:hypothetical protein